MTPEEEARTIRITFAASRDEAPRVDLGATVTIGELAWAAWELDQQARDARTGQLMAQARERAQIASVAAGIRNGGRA